MGATSVPGQGHSRPDAALPVSSSPAGTPEGCPPYSRGGTQTSSLAPPPHTRGVASPGWRPPDPAPHLLPTPVLTRPRGPPGMSPVWSGTPGSSNRDDVGLGGDLLHRHPLPMGTMSLLRNAGGFWGGFSILRMAPGGWLRVAACHGPMAVGGLRMCCAHHTHGLEPAGVVQQAPTHGPKTSARGKRGDSRSSLGFGFPARAARASSDVVMDVPL